MEPVKRLIARPPYSRDVGVPEGYDWSSLTTRRGADIETHYVALLRRLGLGPRNRSPS